MPPPRGADGIVVLTGGEDRIALGVELFSRGLGQRMLISGVDPRNRTPDELSRRVRGPAALFHCCIDLGHEAVNTSGNAEEARVWAQTWGFRSLLVVTSSFHMPRSLAEFSRTMPDVELIAHPVPPRYGFGETWWLNRSAVRQLVGEYAKLIAATARLGLSRVLVAWQPGSVVQRKPATPAAI